MYASTFVSRFPIGFVARGALPKGVFPEAATFSRWTRRFWVLLSPDKSTSPKDVPARQGENRMEV